MPRDNQDTNPMVILSRNKSRANPARLNMELALSVSDQTASASGTGVAASPGTISAQEIALGTGGTVGGRFKVSPNVDE